MAENIGWLVRQQAAGTKVVIDAHNTHVSAARVGLSDMGRRLREKWGTGYVAVGFAFGQGSFLALDGRNGAHANAFVAFEAPPAPADTLDGALSLAKLSAFVVDLRAEGAPIAWLRSLQRMHSVGGVYDGGSPFVELSPGRSFDAIIYIGRVSPIHAIP